MPSYATHPGKVTFADSDVPKKGTLFAVANVDGMLSLDDRITDKVVTCEVGPDGTLQGSGLKVPILSGLLWTLVFKPNDKAMGDKVLGTYNLNTSLVPLHTLIPTVVNSVTASVYADIQAAIALGATNDTATASFVNNGASSTTGALKRRELTFKVTNPEYGAVGNGSTDDLTAVNAAITAAAAAASGASSLVPNAYVEFPFTTNGYAISDKPNLANGVRLRGWNKVKLKLTAARTRMIDFDGLTNAHIEGFTIDDGGKSTSATVRFSITSVDCTATYNVFAPSGAVSKAVTNKQLTSNVAILTVGASHGFNVNDVVSVYGVNGTSVSDAGVFNNPTVTITATTSTTISYAVTHADISSTAAAGYVTRGLPGANVYTVALEDCTRCHVEYNTLNGVRAGIRSYQGVQQSRVHWNTFNGWGDRAIFGLGSMSGCASGVSVRFNTINQPSQQFGDPHQPIAWQGVASAFHGGVICEANWVYGTTQSATVTNKALTSNVATLTTAAAHGFAVGAPITISGVDATFNGQYNVASVPTSTTFTYAKTNANVTSAAATGNVFTLVGHHTGKSNNDLLGGTADSISFHHSENFKVVNNWVFNAGEVGITISNDSRSFLCQTNHVIGSNSAPIALDWGTGASAVGGGDVSGNYILNGGQERGQASTGDAPRTGVTAAIWLAGTTNVHVHDNTAEDNQPTPTMTSLLYIKDVTTNLNIGKNPRVGGCTTLTHASTSYTGTATFYTETGGAPQVAAFTTAGSATWTKPAGAVRVEGILIGGGSGGGSARRGAAASVRAGGSGGAGGARLVFSMLASDLGATEAVVVGAGGAGGAAQTVDSTDGNAGSAGVASSFGTTGASTRWATTQLGGGGSGGSTGAGTGGTAAAPGSSVGTAASATGAAGATSNNGTGRPSLSGAGAGASGAGITSANAEAGGGSGAPAYSGLTTAATAGTAGGGGAGGAGAAGAASAPNTRAPGGGGAGGGSSLTAAGGAGGAGGLYGGGGGGGGASVNGSNSGAGGNGADGAVFIITYFS